LLDFIFPVAVCAPGQNLNDSFEHGVLIWGFKLFLFTTSLFFFKVRKPHSFYAKIFYHFLKSFPILYIEGLIAMHCCIMLLKSSHCSTKMHISCNVRFFILFVWAWGTWWLVFEADVFLQLSSWSSFP
jgi:hypothetical protein